MIEEIKKAEEKGENLKKNGENEGQQLLEKTREKGEKKIAALDDEREKLLEKELNKARKTIDAEIKKLDAQHEKNTIKIENSYKMNKEKAVKKTQELILKWPSSQ